MIYHVKISTAFQIGEFKLPSRDTIEVIARGENEARSKVNKSFGSVKKDTNVITRYDISEIKLVGKEYKVNNLQEVKLFKGVRYPANSVSMLKIYNKGGFSTIAVECERFGRKDHDSFALWMPDSREFKDAIDLALKTFEVYE